MATTLIGQPISRIEGPLKVSGRTEREELFLGRSNPAGSPRQKGSYSEQHGPRGGEVRVR